MSRFNALVHLLSTYFDLLGGSPTASDLVRRLRAIDNLDDLVAIDSDLNDPLWRVVPQIIMHNFGLTAFKEFRTRHTAAKSFAFIHPAYSRILPQLQEALNQYWVVGKPVTYELSKRLICSLYGGYRWHDAYAAACQYRGDIGGSALIIPLEPITQASLQELISYKNKYRSHLAKKIIIHRTLIGQEMDGVIQSFHCPDVIENTRQLLNIGLVTMDDLSDGHSQYHST